MFIVFEGIDGSGKSTQIPLLKSYLQKNTKRNVQVTREPGGTDIAEDIRKILFNKNLNDHFTELFLYMAARREHFIKKIKPALDAQEIIICDRFMYSTLAYQGYGFGIDLKIIESLHEMIIPSQYLPTVTFILDVEVEHAIARAEGHKKYESTLDQSFYNRVREGFIKMSQRENVYLIDANMSIAKVQKRIVNIIDLYLLHPPNPNP